MPILLLLVVAARRGLLIALAVRAASAGRARRRPPPTPSRRPSSAARAARLVARRATDPSVATGLALTAALGDHGRAAASCIAPARLPRPRQRRRSRRSTRARPLGQRARHAPLDARCSPGHAARRLADRRRCSCVALADLELRRRRVATSCPSSSPSSSATSSSRTAIKDLVDRARPTLNPIAADARPVVPERALLHRGRVLRRRGADPRPAPRRAARALLAGGAVGIAVAVAASRVLLDVHWLSDVIAGLALGWAWFALCAIAFGGRLLHFGEPVERAAARRAQPPREHATAPAGGEGVDSRAIGAAHTP